MARIPNTPAAETEEPLVDTTWSRDWGCWVVSSTYRGNWTLVGLFGDSAAAFRAARSAAASFGSGAWVSDSAG